MVGAMSGQNETVRIIDEHTVEVTLPSKLGYERIAMECSATFARIVGFLPSRIEDLKTAVAEACLNAIEHGNKGRPEARVMVTMDFRDDTFRVCVTDEGQGIATPPREPDIEAMVENPEHTRGMGIFLIKQLVDNVKFNRMSGAGHEVTMEIKLTG
jgi:serine/threonine-protein kinase RsbW